MNKYFKIKTLGCKVNAYESQAMKDMLRKNGYKKAIGDSKVSVYIINTCYVTSMSEKKSRQAINKAIRENKSAIIIVMGCYAQGASDYIKNIKGVNIIIGTSYRDKIIKLIDKYKKEKKQIVKISKTRDAIYENISIATFDNHQRAYVKIQDGCNNFCTYCIIPHMRKNVRSRDKKEILKEINALEEKGFEEIVLTGIHTGGYGLDLKDFTFYDLLLYLKNNLKKIKRIRISSIEATQVSEKIINLIKNNKIFLNHLHIPIQSGSDSILKKMKRKYTKKEFVDKIHYIKSKIKNINITTDFIVGFPSEKGDQFSESIKTLQQCEFSKIHVFPFSRRENTPAYHMDEQVDPMTKKSRVKEALNLSSFLEGKYNKIWIGKEVEVLFEKKLKNKDYMIGKTNSYVDLIAPYDEKYVGKICKVNVLKINENNLLVGKVKK